MSAEYTGDEELCPRCKAIMQAKAAREVLSDHGQREQAINEVLKEVKKEEE